MSEGKSAFSVYHQGDLLGEIILNAPGEFNILNALAAVAACYELEVPFETIADGLLGFAGVSRRFEKIGEVDDILLIDDYAHHPSEIKATLNTAQKVYNRRVIVVYQPHLYSRTRDFQNDFTRVLSLADKTLLVDIYPAREEPIEGISSKIIVEKAQEQSLGDFEYIGPKENAIDRISQIARPGDMIITMGAGSITLIKNKILDKLKNR